MLDLGTHLGVACAHLNDTTQEPDLGSSTFREFGGKMVDGATTVLGPDGVFDFAFGTPNTGTKING